MNTYQEVLITCGYNDACVYAYLLNMADENGDFTTSIAQLSDITGLSPKQLRTILVRLERANVTANKRANGRASGRANEKANKRKVPYSP